MEYRIKSVEVVRHPVLRVTFDDGLAGEYDLSEMIAEGPAFARLKDEAGHEIDFCPDATRIRIETQKVNELADQYRMRRSAAE
jgi:hypothetical protein